MMSRSATLNIPVRGADTDTHEIDNIASEDSVEKI
jgi:hypothetical protein